MSDVKISQCKKKIPCIDCDDTECWHNGKKSADCPKYRCDREGEGYLNCDNCALVDRIVDNMRKRMRRKRRLDNE